MIDEHLFPYEWKLVNGYPSKGIEKNNLKVFSCFSCGGGSTMGYKLAGCDVIGNLEIDKKINDVYISNHHPKYNFCEDIRDFKIKNDLSKELYNLDILDGSPPCSTFSIAGQREKNWGKEKKFKEGQKKQVLDTLFFDFIDLANKLRPKIVIVENVKGLIMGKAKEMYVGKIHNSFEKIGYTSQDFLLDSSKMGVPQKRERVFFIAIRNDLKQLIKVNDDLFENTLPYINLKFNEKEILFKEIMTDQLSGHNVPSGILKWLNMIEPGENCSKVHPQKYCYQEIKVSEEKTLPTLRAGCNSYYFERKQKKYHEKRFGDVVVDEQRVLSTLCSSNQYFLENKMDMLNDIEIMRASTFPLDYDFKKSQPIYICGMSVPPVMMAQIVTRIIKYYYKIF
jgi:DNA (cytosine-5)-methyltransferase 1